MQAVRSKDRKADEDAKPKFRRKVNPNSPPTTIEIHGIRVHFPFRPYNCQEVYMTKVMEALIRSENALLESPTGTGKTLCLLCACLAWQREASRGTPQQSAVTNPVASMSSGVSTTTATKSTTRVPVIVYASRTHSQLSQVVRELRNTRYRPPYAVLGSREQMCVNPKIKKANSTAFDINHGCSQLCKERKCRFRNGLEGFQAPANEEGAGDTLDHPVMDMEDLISMGKQHNVCPFYYSRSQLEKAELILVPYNYLFDRDARKTSLSDVPWENAVVIFDEAHNLESFASDSASFDLTLGDIAGCTNEVQKALNYVEAMPEVKNDFQLKWDTMLQIKNIFIKLANYIDHDLGPQTAYSGEFIMEIFKKGAGITYDNHTIFIEEVTKLNNLFMDIRGSATGRGAPRIEHFVQCLKRVFGSSLESKCYAKAAFYRVYVSPKTVSNNQQQKVRAVSYWCFAPSVAMEEVAGMKVRSILVTSGTLSPLPSYSMELGLPFHHTLENPHIISNEQIHVRVVGKGVSGKILNSSYERRKDGEYYTELGNTIASLAKVIPAGMLVFFPSYNVMDTCIEHWGGPASNKQAAGQGNASFFQPRIRQTVNSKYSFPQTPSFYYESSCPCTPWKRLLTNKAVVIEPKSTSDLPDAIAEFKRYLAIQKSPGCVLMGVCRGKLSEGIDFAHEQSRAVVITGLPFAPSHDPKVKMKREFLDGNRANSSLASRNDGGFGASLKGSSMHLSGHEWYTQQAHRAVNQAIGRVIRNVSDYGAVLLLDSRFEQKPNQEGLSKWLRPHIQKDEGFGVTIRALAKFYGAAGEKAKEMAAKLSPQLLTLEYQSEGDLGQTGEETLLSKVAVVRSTSNPASQLTHGTEDNVEEPSNYVPPNRVVATLDMQQLQKRPVSTLAPVVDGPAKKGKVSNDAVFQVSEPRAKRSIGDNSVAAQFFDRARQKLTPTELCSLKRAIVAMKDHGQKMNTSGYIAAAGEVIKQIVRCDGLEQSHGKRTSSNMLLLFFKLLPTQYQGDVTTLAMKHTFDTSQLGRHAKETLPPLSFKQFRTLVVALLQSLWCSDAIDVDSTYLSKAETIVKTMMKSGRIGMTALVNCYINLLPVSHHSCTRNLIHEMVASLKIDRMRVADKGKCLGLVAPKECGAPTPSVVATNKEYVKPPPASLPEVQGKPATENSIPSEIKTPSVMARKPLHPRIAPSHGSLQSMLKRVESDTYVQPNLSDIVRRIPNTSTESLTCPVCSAVASEPCMAGCGHVACLACWKEWLPRSKTCPSCRVSTSMESIARVVFENRPSGDVPRSLSQLISVAAPNNNLNDNNEDSSSEDELELCRT